MTFLNPLVLFGLIAAGVPVLIHLLQFKNLRQVQFSSIRFLKQIQQASARRIKLRDYLLLILRGLAVAFLVMAFARPMLKGIGSRTSKTESVVIIDDSPSTTARNEYGEIFSQLKNTASSIIGSFSKGDNVVVLFTSGLVKSRLDNSEFLSGSNPESLLPVISTASASDARVSYQAAVDAALKRLESSNFISKDIYLLGDFQRSELVSNESNEKIPKSPMLPGRSNLFLVQTGETSDDNLSVSGVTLSDPVVETNLPAEIQATVANNGSSGRDGVVVSLYLDNRKVAQSVLDLPAHRSQIVRLAFSVADGGFHDGAVEIDDNSIQIDNRFYFSFFAIRELNVLIVTEDQINDFVLGAVNSIPDTAASIVVNAVPPDRFAYSNLTDVDVVIVERYPNDERGSLEGQDIPGKLRRFVHGGGGVLLIAPSTAQSNEFGRLLEALKLGELVGNFSSSGGNFLSIDRIDAGDDFYSGLFTSKGSAEQLKDELVTKISNMARINPTPFTRTLINTSDGPFLIGRELGGGFAFALSSPADSSSSNFTLSPFFPVIMQRALFYSASVKHKPKDIYVGEETGYDYVPGGIKSGNLTVPDGTATDVVPEYVGGTARFLLRGFNVPGVYALTVENPQGGAAH